MGDIGRSIPLLSRARKRTQHFARNTLDRISFTKGAKCQDVMWTSLTALIASSDGFPPLKSVVGAVASVWEIAQRMEQSKKEAHELAHRSVAILEIIADAIPDPLAIPAPMLASILRFETVLQEIHAEMNRLMGRSRMWRLTHLNRSEGSLGILNKRLDEVTREFMIASSVRVEARVHDIQARIVNNGAESLEFHHRQVILLKQIILIQTAFFCSSPVLAV
ncbi:hypothetical protein B0H10DRAFT_2429232 [Mycena sp. CBHHK59/15]|nr:hypothetical protein B0H10DRAFT_2429232 [Mycena sp. CBHHK59/15]